MSSKPWLLEYIKPISYATRCLYVIFLAEFSLRLIASIVIFNIPSLISFLNNLSWKVICIHCSFALPALLVNKLRSIISRLYISSRGRSLKAREVTCRLITSGREFDPRWRFSIIFVNSARPFVFGFGLVYLGARGLDARSSFVLVKDLVLFAVFVLPC